MNVRMPVWCIYDNDSLICFEISYFEGFTDGSDACCGIGAYWGSGCGKTEGYELCSNPGDYVWFDGAHTTERANLQLAELIWSGIPNVTGPYNVKQLFGLVWLMTCVMNMHEFGESFEMSFILL